MKSERDDLKNNYCHDGFCERDVVSLDDSEYDYQNDVEFQNLIKEERKTYDAKEALKHLTREQRIQHEHSLELQRQSLLKRIGSERESIARFNSKINKSYIDQKSVGHFYHSSLRGLDEGLICYNISDYYKLINLIFEAGINYNTKILAYVIMSNHFHIISHSAHIIEFFKYIRSQYSRYLKDKYGFTGAIFPRDIRSSLIKNSIILQDKILYVLRNPVHHEVCSSPFDYKWSSLRAHFSHEEIVDGKIYSMTEMKYVKLVFKKKYMKQNLSRRTILPAKCLVDNDGHILPESLLDKKYFNTIFKTRDNLYHLLKKITITEILNGQSPDLVKNFYSYSPELQKEIYNKKCIELLKYQQWLPASDSSIIREIKSISRDLHTDILNFSHAHDEKILNSVIQELRNRLTHMTAIQCHRILHIPLKILDQRYWRQTSNSNLFK